jgi:MFS transporter, DHA1 family, tetracycline resistance protein
MRRSALLIIFLIVFIDLVGFGIVIPILPYYSQTYGASGWALGWLMTTYSLLQFLFTPVWGRISDKVGRRPVLLVSLFGTGVGMCVLGFAPSLEWIFIGRIIAGICGGNISTAYAYVADITVEKDRAKGMGLIGAGFGLGFIFGPAIGGILSKYGYGVPMFAGAGLAFLNLLFAFIKLEEPRLSPEARSANRARRFDLESTRIALGDRRTRLAITLSFLFTFAFAQMETVFAIYFGAQYGYDAKDAGMLLALMGIVMVSVQGGMIGVLVRRFGEVRLISTGILICVIGLTSFASLNSLTFVVISLCVLAFGHGILHPSLSSLASLGATSEHRGVVMGVFHSASSLARVFAPPCAGWLYDHISGRAPFYAGSIVLCVAFGIAFVWANPATEPKPLNVPS